MGSKYPAPQISHLNQHANRRQLMLFLPGQAGQLMSLSIGIDIQRPGPGQPDEQREIIGPSACVRGTVRDQRLCLQSRSCASFAILGQQPIEQNLTDMEIRGLQRREGRRQIDHATIGRAGENSQRASNDKAPGFRDRGARSLVDENELRPIMPASAMAARSPSSRDRGKALTSISGTVCTITHEGGAVAHSRTDNGAPASSNSARTSTGTWTISNSRGSRSTDSISTK